MNTSDVGLRCSTFCTACWPSRCPRWHPRLLERLMAPVSGATARHLVAHPAICWNAMRTANHSSRTPASFRRKLRWGDCASPVPWSQQPGRDRRIQTHGTESRLARTATVRPTLATSSTPLSGHLTPQVRRGSSRCSKPSRSPLLAWTSWNRASVCWTAPSVMGNSVTDLLADRHYSYKAEDRWYFRLLERGIRQHVDLHPNDQGFRDYNGMKLAAGWMHCPCTPDRLGRIDSPPPNTSDAIKEAFAKLIEERQQYAMRTRHTPRFGLGCQMGVPRTQRRGRVSVPRGHRGSCPLNGLPVMIRTTGSRLLQQHVAPSAPSPRVATPSRRSNRSTTGAVGSGSTATTPVPTWKGRSAT